MSRRTPPSEKRLACWVRTTILKFLQTLTITRQTPSHRDQRRPNPRSRSNTAHSYSERYSTYEEPPPMPEPEPVRQSIRSQARVASTSRLDTRMDNRMDTHDEYEQTESPRRATISRASTFQGPTAIYRESPISDNRKNTFPTDVGAMRSHLRPSTNRVNSNAPDVFGDPSDDSTLNSNSPDRSYGARSVSPATSYGSVSSRSATLSNAPNGRKGPPPPPPSRSKKPPPPPPMKRADMSSVSVNRY